MMYVSTCLVPIEIGVNWRRAADRSIIQFLTYSSSRCAVSSAGIGRLALGLAGMPTLISLIPYTCIPQHAWPQRCLVPLNE